MQKIQQRINSDFNQREIPQIYSNDVSDSKLQTQRREFENLLQTQRRSFESLLQSQANEFESKLKAQGKNLQDMIKSSIPESKLESQRKEFEELLQVQRRNFESLLKSQMNEFESKLKSQEMNLQEMSDKRIDDPKERNDLLSQLAEKTKELEKIKKELEEFKKKQDQKVIENGSTIRNKSLEINNAETFQNLDSIGEIGSGSSGRVIKVVNKDLFAYKIVDFLKEDKSLQQQMLSDYEILNAVSHPNILKTYAIYLSDGKFPLSFLNEFSQMNLEDVIKNDLLSKPQKTFVIYQIIEGMKYLHSKKIIHRNLKPSNILIDSIGTIKIADYGISKLYTVSEQLSKENISNQKFMSPEMLNEENYNEKTDVFSFGVIVIAMLNGGNIESIKVRDIILGKKIQIQFPATQLSKMLIESCLSIDQNLRPSFDIISEVLLKNDCNLIEMTNSEKKEFQKLIDQYKTQIPSYK